MQNQINYSLLLDKLPNLAIAVMSLVAIIGSYFYIKNILKKVTEIEENIFIVKDWIDNLIYIVIMQRGPISQPMLEKITEHEKKPLENELERLKMERQFLLDRVPLLGVLKK